MDVGRDAGTAPNGGVERPVQHHMSGEFRSLYWCTQIASAGSQISKPIKSELQPSNLDLIIQYDARRYFTASNNLGRTKGPWVAREVEWQSSDGVQPSLATVLISVKVISVGLGQPAQLPGPMAQTWESLMYSFPRINTPAANLGRRSPPLRPRVVAG